MQDRSSTTFAKAVRAERKRLQMTQDQLAVAVGTTQQNVAGWEAGKSLPRPETFDRLVETFGPHSVVAALPPRGEIQMAYQLIEDVMVKSKGEEAVGPLTLVAQAQAADPFAILRAMHEQMLVAHRPRALHDAMLAMAPWVSEQTAPATAQQSGAAPQASSFAESPAGKAA